MRAMLRLIVVLGLCGLAFAAGMRIDRILTVNACLDAGGRWSAQRGACIGLKEGESK